jgi:hypothetical protein
MLEAAMSEREKPDLSSIEPIGKLPEDEAEAPVQGAERVGRAAAATTGSPPAVGVEATTLDSSPSAGPSDEERELDKLRRG